MCVLPEMSLIFSSVDNDSPAHSTSVEKFSVDDDSQRVLKSNKLSSVEEVINSLHCVKSMKNYLF